MSEVTTITDAQRRTLEMRRDTAQQQLAVATAQHTELQAAADELWPGDDTTVDSDAYAAWAAKAEEALAASQVVLRSHAVLRKVLAQLAAAGDTAAGAQLDSVAPGGARELVQAVLSKPQRAPRAPRQQQADPPGTEEIRARMDANKPGSDEYKRARAAGEADVQELHRAAYTAYKQAYRQMLDARKAAAGGSTAAA